MPEDKQLRNMRAKIIIGPLINLNRHLVGQLTIYSDNRSIVMLHMNFTPCFIELSRMATIVDTTSIVEMRQAQKYSSNMFNILKIGFSYGCGVLHRVNTLRN